MQRTLGTVLVLLALVALIPFACVARSRAMRSGTPPVNLWSDMDAQPKYGPQEQNPLFADRRAMRPPVEGTVARGELRDDERVELGIDGGDYVRSIPVPVTAELLRRGRERFEVFCAPCHGLAGYGDGMVSERAIELQQGTWVPPSSFHDETVLSRPAGHLFNTVTNGIRNMPAYGSQIPVADRWAIVGYVRALQRSQAAKIADVPAPERERLTAERTQ